MSVTMSAAAQRAVQRLAAPNALLAQTADKSWFGVFANGDRRRRPLARIKAGEVRELAASGALEACSGGYVLSSAGRASARREGAAPEERYIAQHAAIADRSVIDGDGDVRVVRGVAQSSVLARLAQLRDAAGAPWLKSEELRAAQIVRRDWEAAQAGLSRGLDWSAPPLGGNAARAANAQEMAMAARCDARKRVALALDALAPPLRRVVERACIQEEGLEAIERAENWPARSGKLALKLGLAQLAAALG